MALVYQPNGNLAVGTHKITWDEFQKEFSYNKSRKALIDGLVIAIKELKNCGCTSIYVGGSFVTKKSIPNDFDVCWDPTGVDMKKLLTDYPIFFDFDNSRKNQKKKYGGEFFPTILVATPYPKELYIDFFKHDKEDNPKGLIHLQL